ncbi:MAG TPA: UDP-N-acetylglucosamine 2-epimerase, partial [Acidobacteriaceae bacterium]
MSTRRRIAVVTTSRADYSHLYWPLRDLAAHPEVDLQLLVCGAHLSPAFGSTVKEMERDGFAIAERIECLVASDTDVGMAKTLGLAVLGLADTLARLRPDLLLLIADRYEMLAPAAVGLTLRIPIAHIEGGDISEGAIDDAVRNAITKMAHLHFTSTEGARARVIGMGEEPWRVRRAGAPSLDHLRRGRLLGREELEAALGVSLEQRPIVIATHPVTLLRDTTEEAEALFSALHYLTQHRAYRRHPLLFCYPNADAGSQALVERARRFCEHHPAASLDKDPGRPAPSAAGLLRTHARAAASGVTEPAAGARLFVNLPAGTYWSLLAQAEMLVGNSSSG